MHVHEVPPHKVHAHEMYAYEMMNREIFDSSLSIPRRTPAKEALARVSESDTARVVFGSGMGAWK
jgi:hypothetical protein